MQTPLHFIAAVPLLTPATSAAGGARLRLHTRIWQFDGFPISESQA